jgi:large repetitive protein
MLQLALTALAGTSHGVTLVDFEDLSFSGPGSYSGTSGSYWNGCGDPGGFASRGAQFNNSYDPTFDAFSGWSYSNVNDTTTGDYTNGYAAITGTGVGGVGNYAVAFGYKDMFKYGYGGVVPSITIPYGMHPQSIMVTNTTYAAIVMRDGNWASSPFGPNDWFKLTITGTDASNNPLTPVVTVDLAKDGSILDCWKAVDLSSLGAAKTLIFDLASSDTGKWGINTPAYFAMDNLTLVPEPSIIALLVTGGLTILAWFWRRRMG